MNKVIALLAILLLLPGCTGFGVYSALDGLEAKAEAERRVALKRLEDRKCKMPLDWVADLHSDRGDDWLRGYRLQCPQFDRMVDALED